MTKEKKLSDQIIHADLELLKIRNLIKLACTHAEKFAGMVGDADPREVKNAMGEIQTTLEDFVMPAMIDLEHFLEKLEAEARMVGQPAP